LVNASPREAQVELSYDEILVLNNALNETCNGLDIAEFQTRIGVDREDVVWLLGEVRNVLKRIEEAAHEGE